MWDLASVKGVYLIGLFKVAGHLGKELAFSDTHIDGEAQFIPDLILNGVSQCDGIRIDTLGTTEIRKAFVYTDLFHNRSKLFHDRNECVREGFIEFEIRSGKKEIGAFAQSCSNRFAGLNTELLCRYGFGKDHTGALFPVPANGRGDQSDIILSHTDSAGCFPGQEGTIHIDMENQSVHSLPPFLWYRYYSKQ